MCIRDRGVYGVIQQPEVLQAMNPVWAVRFFGSHPGIGVAILGATVLALTGAEALYADICLLYTSRCV